MNRWRLSLVLLVLVLAVGPERSPAREGEIREYPVPPGSHPRDVAPAPGKWRGWRLPGGSPQAAVIRFRE